MDPATLATGLDTLLDSFATAFGPIILLVVGFAVGIYGIKLGWGLLTNYVRVRAAR